METAEMQWKCRRITKGLFCSIFSVDVLDGLLLVLANPSDLQEGQKKGCGGW